MQYIELSCTTTDDLLFVNCNHYAACLKSQERRLGHSQYGNAVASGAREASDIPEYWWTTAHRRYRVTVLTVSNTDF
jgi:hypothetical protein